MIHSRVYLEHPSKRPYYFSTDDVDRPLVAQFCGNVPETLLSACQLIEDRVDAIDINFGCPQNIARRGNYGAFLMSQPDLMVSLVTKLAENLKIPVYCKIRVYPDEDQTIALAKRLQDAGCSLLAVHGRTKEQRSEPANWNVIKRIKETLSIPVVSNGNVITYQDAQNCLKETGVDGVMSAVGLLENPALFSGKLINKAHLAAEYLEYAEKYKASKKSIRRHLFYILKEPLQDHVDLRDALGYTHTTESFCEIVRLLQARLGLELYPTGPARPGGLGVGLDVLAQAAPNIAKRQEREARKAAYKAALNNQNNNGTMPGDKAGDAAATGDNAQKRPADQATIEQEGEREAKKAKDDTPAQA
eukprot:TRINITY_DN917_c1_g1_i4.p1 TRINITY_DN917_c1_g1~~TRINITY_DN917_c1_g1_i4.p1  ORF type:complete len:360 (-),score=76.68 TRINITY_DN917_c1_g1_i4:235-1314(-)